MFTGIVQGMASIEAIHSAKDFKTLTIKFPENSLLKLKTGASIAINGTCLTVREFNLNTHTASFDVIQETLAITNLNDLKSFDKVNFERAAKIGDEIGGHLMSGHIHASIKIKRIKKTTDNISIFFETPNEFQKFLLPKGFAGLNGCSLTLGDISSDEFSVHLIPETLEMTTFGASLEGDWVNLEIDSQTQSIVNTVERILNNA